MDLNKTISLIIILSSKAALTSLVILCLYCKLNLLPFLFLIKDLAER